MGKGQVTTDDLATGIKGFGGISSLGGAPRPVRDNPFRDTRSEAAVPVVAPAETSEPTPVYPLEPELPRLEVIAVAEQKAEEVRGEEPAPKAAPIERKAATPIVPRRVPAPARPAVKHLVAEVAAASSREKKTEVYTELVTVPLNAEMRDRSEALAKDIHRRRTEKGERITTNTVIRVALRAMLDSFHPGPDLVINTESDLYDALVQHLRRK